MDVLERWGMYAPALLYLWIIVSYSVAYVRTRKLQMKTQPSLFFSVAVFGLLQLLTLFRGPEENPSTPWWITYVMYLFWPLVLMFLFHGIGRKQQFPGYQHPLDVLLFRSPAAHNTISTGPVLRYSCRTLGTIVLVGVNLLLAGISYASISLQMCGWLDITLARSGCLRSVAIDREAIQSLAFSPDGALLAVGSSEQSVRLYRVADGQVQRILKGHSDWVTSVAFSPDGEVLASGSWDGTVRLWRVANGEVIRTLHVRTSPSSKTINIAFSPDGTLFAAGTGHTSLQVWRVGDGSLVARLPSSGDALAFSPNSHLIAVEHPADHITLWELNSRKAVQTFVGHKYGITGLAFAPDGLTLVSSSGGEDTIKVWQADNGILLQTFIGPARTNVAISPDGSLIASGGMSDNIQHLRGLIEVWDIGGKQGETSWEGHRTLVNSVAFAPNGKILASGSSWETIRLWRVKP